MGFMSFTLKETFSSPLSRKIQEAGPKAAHIVAVQIKNDTKPFVPALTLSLANRSHPGIDRMYKRTKVEEDTVIYPGPYARYLYYGRVMVYKDPPYLRNVNGRAVLSHFGQRKTPIGKPLKIQQSVHPKAQSHWYEASKAQNKQKWLRVAERAIKNELDK